MTLSDLEWLSKIFNDMKHRIISLRQLSFWCCIRMLQKLSQQGRVCDAAPDLQYAVPFFVLLAEHTVTDSVLLLQWEWTEVVVNCSTAMERSQWISVDRQVPSVSACCQQRKATYFLKPFWRREPTCCLTPTCRWYSESLTASTIYRIPMYQYYIVLFYLLICWCILCSRRAGLAFFRPHRLKLIDAHKVSIWTSVFRHIAWKLPIPTL